ncbi:MAG: hypothetical protein PGN12_01865 [Sphingomonas phyllosphaerae]
MRLHAIKAEEGDCLLLESGEAEPVWMLIDGGPAGTWDAVAGTYVREIVGHDGSLDVVAVSHVDADHIIGILDLLADVERDRADGAASMRIADLWHNSFSETVDDATGSIGKGLQAILDVAGAQQFSMPESAISLFGIAEGARLRRSATRLGIPINAAFGGAVISPSSLDDPVRNVGSMRVTVVGPTAKNLDQLRTAWLAWLAKHGDRLADMEALANADRSVPNLSSIVLLVEEGSRRMLLTGDARGDHILQGLDAGGLLTEGAIHLDVLKLPHHGSDRNIDRTFFDKVTADVYVISANGKHGNPDEATLTWLVEASREQGRRPKILVTHASPSLDAFRASRPPEVWGYELLVAEGSSHVILL